MADSGIRRGQPLVRPWPALMGRVFTWAWRGPPNPDNRLVNEPRSQPVPLEADMSDKPANSDHQLAAEAGIRRTLARYCHTIDDGDFAALAECFAPDAELAAFGRTRSGREAVAALLAKAMPPENRGTHLTCNTVISEVAGAGEATVTASALSDFAFIGRDGSITTGRYTDEFVAIDGRWLIASRKIALGG
jgi:uncharacterized protein (TIGR02246 family)